MLATKLPKEGCPVPPTRGLELPVPSILVIPEHDWRLLAARLVPKNLHPISTHTALDGELTPFLWLLGWLCFQVGESALRPFMSQGPHSRCSPPGALVLPHHRAGETTPPIRTALASPTKPPPPISVPDPDLFQTPQPHRHAGPRAPGSLTPGLKRGPCAQ